MNIGKGTIKIEVKRICQRCGRRKGTDTFTLTERVEYDIWQAEPSHCDRCDETTETTPRIQWRTKYLAKDLVLAEEATAILNYTFDEYEDRTGPGTVRRHSQKLDGFRIEVEENEILVYQASGDTLNRAFASAQPARLYVGVVEDA